MYKAAGTASNQHGLEVCTKCDRPGNVGFMSAQCAKNAPQQEACIEEQFKVLIFSP